MLRITLTIALFLALATSVVSADNMNLSEMISGTYPLMGKCPPINGEKAYTLASQTDASVYFRHCGGFVSGYLVAGEIVYAVPDGAPSGRGQWMKMTRAVRCGNPAKGRFFIPVPPCPAPEVIVQEGPERTRTEYRYKPLVVPQIICVPQTTVVAARQYISPAGVSAVWTPAAPIATGSTTVGPWQDRATLSLLLVPSPGQRECKPPNGDCPKGEPGPEPPPNGGTPGDPSGQAPCPPATDPNRPADQANHQTGGKPWGPQPDHPNVADPVN